MTQGSTRVGTVKGTLRSASLVSVGTLSGQLIAFFGSLVLVRIFSPAQMGLFTTIVAVASFVSPLASGRLASAIPLPERNKSGITLAKMGVFASLAVGTLVGLFMLGGTVLLEESDFNHLWWWALPALIVSLSVYSSANQLAVRFEQYFGLALRGVLYPLAMTGIQIALGLVHFGASGLILGMVLGHCVTALTLWFPIQRSAKLETGQSEHWKTLLTTYRHFPIFLGPAGAINAFAMQLPQIGVTFLFGLTVGGQFGMMLKILAVPITLVGQSISFVYAGQIAKARRSGETNVQGLFDRLSLILGALGLIFAIGVVFLAEPIFAWLLGEEWRMSGELAALFVISTATQLVSSPLSQTLVISERIRLQLTLDLVRSFMLFIAIAALYLMEISVSPAILIIGTVSAMGYVFQWSVNRKTACDIT